MALHIHHGPHLLPLTNALAEVLAQPLVDPFEAEVVAVPTAGVRDWLQQQLAYRLGASGTSSTSEPASSRGDGVTANIEFVFPGRFVAAALGTPITDDDPWSVERLTWAVLRVLQSGDVIAPGGQLPPALTARRIADLFDGYATNRPQILQQWWAGRDGDGTVDAHGAVVPLAPDQCWQPRLWRAVRALIGVPTRAELLPDLLAELSAGSLTPALPDRVALFGVSTISAAQLSVVRALSAVRDTHVFIVHPSSAAWTAGSSRALAGGLEPRSAFDAAARIKHPLLRSWGRPALEAASLVSGIDAVQHEYARPAETRAPTAGSSTVLRRLQSDIESDREPAVEFSSPDRSLQVHACHGTTRQLEVLRDSLCHLFADDHTLQARDVVVLCPDLDRFAPLVESVFGRGEMPVPVRLSDLSLGTDNPVAVALAAVLDAISDRCTAAEMVTLCSLDAIRRRLGFTDDDSERIDRWISELGTSWGLDGEHRRTWLDHSIDEGTWTATLDRVLLGAAMPAPIARIGIAGIVPFDDVDAEALATAGRLAELVARLRAARAFMGNPHTIHAWARSLTRLVGELFASDPRDAWQLTRVLESITDLVDQSQIGDTASMTLLTLRDIRSLLASRLAGQRGRLALRSGAVTVTTMVPLRNVPARVVCILGLDEGSLRSSGTGSGALDGDDLLGVRPCVGERDPRAEGRHLLLDALLSASEHVLITCDGSDITTNRELPLPVQLTELIDVLEHMGHPPMIARHPRQAYDPTNFVDQPSDAGPSVDGPFSFDSSMLRGARTRQAASTDAPPFPLLDAIVPDVVTLAQLAEACVRPARTYLLARLDIRLPARIEDIDQNIPLDASPLELSRLGADLLDHVRRNGSDVDDLAPWRAAKRLSGGLPPEQLGDWVLDNVEAEVAAVLDATPELRTLIRATDSRSVELTLERLGQAGSSSTSAAPRGVVQLVDTIERVAGNVLVRASFSRPKNRGRVGAALELAALVLTEPGIAWEAVVVYRPKSNTAPRADAERLVPIGGREGTAAARRLLQVALELRLRALREPLPLFERSSRELHNSGEFDETAFDDDLRDDTNKLLWERFAPDEVLAIPALDDERAVADVAHHSRARVLADLLWNAFDAFIQQPRGDSADGPGEAGEAGEAS